MNETDQIVLSLLKEPGDAAVEKLLGLEKGDPDKFEATVNLLLTLKESTLVYLRRVAAVKQVHYGHSHAMRPDDDRQAHWAEQREERGFDDTETWSLTHSISQFVVPRLRRFKDIGVARPVIYSKERWEAIMDDMIYAFEAYMSDTGTDVERAKRGMKMFVRHFNDLWW